MIRQIAPIFLLLAVANGLQLSSSNLIKDLSENDISYEEIGGNFQGDMILSDRQIRNLGFNPRNGLVHNRFRWPKNAAGKVIVPYAFRNKGEFSKFECTNRT